MAEKPKTKMSDRQHDDNQFVFEQTEKIRQFEVSLIWQRALYFWGLTSVTFVGYAALRGAEASTEPIIAVLVASFGFVSAVGWSLSNRGSKYFFEVWEKKAEQAARRVFPEGIWEIKGKRDQPFYYPTFLEDEPQNPKWPYWSYRYSVTRLSIMVSDFVALVWLLILLAEGANSVSLALLNPAAGTWRAAVTIIIVLISIAYSGVYIFSAGKGGTPG